MPLLITCLIGSIQGGKCPHAATNEVSARNNTNDEAELVTRAKPTWRLHINYISGPFALAEHVWNGVAKKFIEHVVQVADSDDGETERFHQFSISEWGEFSFHVFEADAEMHHSESWCLQLDQHKELARELGNKLVIAASKEVSILVEWLGPTGDYIKYAYYNFESVDD